MVVGSVRARCCHNLARKPSRRICHACHRLRLGHLILVNLKTGCFLAGKFTAGIYHTQRKDEHTFQKFLGECVAK